MHEHIEIARALIKDVGDELNAIVGDSLQNLEYIKQADNYDEIVEHAKQQIKHVDAAISKSEHASYITSQGYCLKGQFYQIMDKTSSAREFYKKSIEASEANGHDPVEALRLLGYLLVINDDNSEALKVFEKIKALRGINDEVGMEAATRIEKLKVAESEGCYIATACYGSYEAPEVLVLRRFRDTVLQSSWLGRLSIQVYYASSPRLARVLKKAHWLNHRIRKYVLSPIVAKLS